MAHTGQWPLRRPRWAALSAAAVAVAGVLSLAYSLEALHAWPLALLAGWHWGRGRPARAEAAGACLRLDELSGWLLAEAGSARPLRLLRAWPARAWVCLRFMAPAPAGSKENMLELTVWKSCVSPEAWRRLQVQIAREAATAAGPGPAIRSAP